MNGWLALVLGLGMSMTVVGCSAGAANDASGSNPTSTQGTGAGVQNTGFVGVQLTLPSGQLIPVIDWQITGPNGQTSVVQSGSGDSNSTGLTFLVGNIPVGTDYQITLSGTATDGSVTCSGGAPFDIAARTTTAVSVNLACVVASSGAQVTLVNGTSFNCAAWGAVSASPLETAVGGSIALSATASGPVPSALTFAWSAPSGTFDTPLSATANFTCTAAGTVPITMTVSDGPVPAGNSCSAALSTKTITVTCSGSQVPSAPSVPAWGLFALSAAMLGIGSSAARGGRESRRTRT
jgi:hypothetical protein